MLLVFAAPGCGPKSVEAKMKGAEKKSDQIGALLDDAERFFAQVEPKKAEAALSEAGRLLNDPDMQYSPEREMFAGRQAELLAKVNEVREARKAKDIEDAVRSERAEIGPSLQAMKDAAEAVGGTKVDEKSVTAAKEAVAALEKAVSASDDRRVFALKDSSFLGYLKRAKAETEKARTVLTKAEKKLAFLSGPVALKQKAAKELKDSRSEKDAEKKRALVTSAVADYAQCLTSGLEFVKGSFSSERISIEGVTTTVESFLATCKAAQKTTEQALAKLPKPALAKKKKK